MNGSHTLRLHALVSGAIVDAIAMVLLLCGDAAIAQQAAPQRLHLHLDPAATEVHFTLKDTVHTVHGGFHLSSGEIDFNPQTGEAHGQIAVDTGSGASGNDSRDGRMKREFLEVMKFPVATFEPQNVSGYNPSLDGQQIAVSGTLTLHGASHALTMNFQVSTAGGLTMATTHFLIPYVAWGIKDPSVPFIHAEKEVAMDIVAKGTFSAGN
jgi:polyisoprenoid-binding protein YceI